jgi:iron complex outermembrane recepter protein
MKTSPIPGHAWFSGFYKDKFIPRTTMRKNRTKQIQTLLSLVSAGVIAAGTQSSLMAQTSEKFDDPIYELAAFEVTGGFADSIAAAAVVKRMQPVVVEMIVAEDIGKLPDSSIAESLARLPGLTTQRINSRAQGIVIRGLQGDFSTGLLNGRQQVSTAGDRSIEFDQYPAELMNGVTVYKTSTPSLIGQGLAGTVNMMTIRPLSLDKRVLATNIVFEKASLGKLNPDSEDMGMKYSLNYADQFLDGKLGIAVGYSKTDQAGQGEQWEAWGYPTTGDGDFVIGGAKPFVRSSEFKRDTIMGVLEFRPNRYFHSTIDVFVSDFKETQILRGLELPLWWSSAQLQPGYEVSNGLVTSGTFNNVYAVMRNDNVWRDADLQNYGWNVRLGDGSGWVFDFDASLSKMERKDNVLETYSGSGANQVGTPDSLGFRMTDKGVRFSSSLNYNDPNVIRLSSPQGWGGDQVPGGQVGFFKGPIAEDELYQLKASVSREFDGMFRRVDAGVAYTRREKFEIEAGPNGLEGWFLSLPGFATSAPLPASVGATKLDFLGFGPMYSYDSRKLWESGYYQLTPNANINAAANNFDVTEKVVTFYVQADFEREISGGKLISGNIGTQIVRSDQSANGFSANGVTLIPVTGSHDYWDIVPSMNLIFNFDEYRKLRFSVARQLARQEMADMRANSNYGFNETLYLSTDPSNSPWSGSGGNPKLEPWRSNSFDLTYENYFSDGRGYWALNGFYKDLVSYTYDEPVLSDFTGYDTNSNLTPAIYQGFRTSPVNGDGGKIWGLEATLSIPGEKLTSVLKGFGLIMGASMTKSDIEVSPGNSQEIPGLSKWVVNSTLYYEKAGFSARVSSRYRSEYRGDISTFGPRGENFRELQAETVVDAQIGYSFQEGSRLDGLSVTFQAYNLTDEPLYGVDNGNTRLVRNYQLYGAQYSLGFAWKF